MTETGQIGEAERVTQKNVIDFFKSKLRYDYLGDLRNQDNKNIMEDRLKKNLERRGEYSDFLIRRAVDELIRVASNFSRGGLMGANKEVYRLLKYGAKVKDETGLDRTVYFIDFADISRNDYEIAEEVTIKGKHDKRPDLVIYVNGIALAVIELKKSGVSVREGISQNLTNQHAHFVESFFSTIQFCMAGNLSEGLRYGTVYTSAKFYLEWKEDGFREHPEECDETDVTIAEICGTIPEKLYRQIFAMFYKKRFLDLIHNFVIFDGGRKKVCRYNQYYAIKRARKRLTDKRQGGIIWHTQGSGKSLTMLWLAKWILDSSNSRIPEAHVLIITDREELDGQIEKQFHNMGEKNLIRAKSGGELISLLDKSEARLICSLVHKFGRRQNGVEIAEADYDRYLKELYKSLPDNFSPKGNWIVFVDECHRTQSGKLHKAMKAILPDAVFIGFTGTPLLKKDKKNSRKVFGDYIHCYKFDEGVRDGVILDLRYETRDISQDITSPRTIDEWFESNTAGLTAYGKAKLKAQWGTLQKVFSSRSRLEKVADSIILDFHRIARLAEGRGNAMLVANNIYEACKYYEIFQSKGFRECAVISSYIPRAGDLRVDRVSMDEETEAAEKYNAYLKMIGVDPSEDSKQTAKKVEAFESDAKEKFIKYPSQMKLLIVVNKLLTGFDAPPCTYLYIDKSMRDHGLFQAICRVNRLDDYNYNNQDADYDQNTDKDFGYIVDFRELFGDLTDAVRQYTGGAFSEFDPDDVDGFLKNQAEEARRLFEKLLDDLAELCEGVKPPKRRLEYQRYFCGGDDSDAGARSVGVSDIFNLLARRRKNLYRLSAALVRAYADFKPFMNDVAYSEREKERAEKSVRFYLELRNHIGRASGDFIDLKAYEPGMRFLIDHYIAADEAERIGGLEEFTLLDFVLSEGAILKSDAPEHEKESAAEAIENNIRKEIVEKMPLNPAYYTEMSAVLERLILLRKQGAANYIEILRSRVELTERIKRPENDPRYPVSIRNSGALRALYDNLDQNEELALCVHRTVCEIKQDGFRQNPVLEKRMKKGLFKILGDQEKVERIYRIIVEQDEY